MCVPVVIFTVFLLYFYQLLQPTHYVPSYSEIKNV